MNPCELMASRLALSAAGLLDPAGEREVRAHAGECPACAARLESLGNLAGALAALPAPRPPEDLELRTQARLAADWNTTEDRRREALLAAGGAALGWVSWLAAWESFQALRGGFASVLRPAWPDLWVWLAFSTLMALLTAPVAAMLARARRRERSLL
jgi:anti-sigma factor RsiW